LEKEIPQMSSAYGRLRYLILNKLIRLLIIFVLNVAELTFDVALIDSVGFAQVGEAAVVVSQLHIHKR
jgi:hypothetical protein